MTALKQSEETATFSKLAVRKGIEELLDGGIADRLGRGQDERSLEENEGSRSGDRADLLKAAGGAVEYSVPRVRGPWEPFRSQVRPELGQRTEALEDLALEMDR